ncbi:hypothetical protein GN331_02875 [Lysobacter sp. HX-5-24]|uniref:Uncharacterized protein n=2 Tax=Noviluteimonas gilva TaxID=2682097 RepID=A0A7C9LL24_9GAMM|nr:hypothetical protein [Lysobacter gilvus]
MREFAERTGVIGHAPPQRYLWTDAFAVCNFLALGETECAERLVEQVHAILGRHRADDTRSGWIGGMDALTAIEHPTRGGLRIGKPLEERAPDALLDAELEWERDGQYFHYLTRWMHALDQFSRNTGHADAGRWARELAQTAHRAFTYAPAPGAPLRMYWKMRIDLSAPLVTAMGQHDPLDGLITTLQLRAHRPAARVGHGPDLDVELREMAAIVAGTNLLSDDPLGIGGLLVDAYRLAQLLRVRPGDNPLLGLVTGAAANGLTRYLATQPFARPLENRLAFRELGLAIGLQAVTRLWTVLERDAASLDAQPTLRRALDQLVAQVPLARAITDTWCDVERSNDPQWRAHEDINAVMLATALVPSGYIELGESTSSGSSSQL